MPASNPSCASPSRHTWRDNFTPFLRWLPLVTRQTIKSDIYAGLTGAVISLPQGVAFAVIAGMPPEYGLYTAMVPAIIAALFGSSWLLVSGPTTAASVVLYSALAENAIPGSPEYVQLAITLTMMVGLTQLIMGLARLGALVNFISHSVVAGFTAGAALLIASSQLKHLFGMQLPRTSSFFETLKEVSWHMDKLNEYAFTVGLITIAAGILLRHFRPRFPYMIGSMLAGTLAAMVINLIYGKEVANLAMVGALPSSLPPLSAPSFTLENIRILAPAVLATTLLALTEAVSIARSLADRSGQSLDGNQEFIGQGLSNIVGSFFSSYVATGSFNRSGINYQAGAKTPLAAVCAGLFLIVLVILVAPLAAYLPNAAMAGILILVAWGLFDLRHIIKIFRTSYIEAVIMVVTFTGTIVLALEFAILLGIMLSLVIYLNRTSHPHIYNRVPDSRFPSRPFVTDPVLPECPQLKIMRIDGSLYFGAVAHVRDQLQQTLAENPHQKNLLIVAKGINFIDMTGAEYLVMLSRERIRNGGNLYMLGLKEGICSHFRLAGYLIDIGVENLFESKFEALEEIFERLDRSVCSRCTARIFLECGSLPLPRMDAPAPAPQDESSP